MGQTLQTLSSKKLDSKAVFNNRFVIEICEKVHIHYRNLRLVLNIEDWVEIAKGFTHSFERWVKRGEPACGNKHIELCRKEISLNDSEESIKINLNKNLYKQFDGKIFAEGSFIEDPTYIHLKIRNVRLELSEKEFDLLSEAVIEAKSKLDEAKCVHP